jgi:hypothetical protein
MCDTVTSCESHKDQAKRTIGLLLGEQNTGRANWPIFTPLVKMGALIFVART